MELAKPPKLPSAGISVTVQWGAGAASASVASEIDAVATNDRARASAFISSSLFRREEEGHAARRGLVAVAGDPAAVVDRDGRGLRVAGGAHFGYLAEHRERAVRVEPSARVAAADHVAAFIHSAG